MAARHATLRAKGGANLSLSHLRAGCNDRSVLLQKQTTELEASLKVRISGFETRFRSPQRQQGPPLLALRAGL